MKAFAELKTWRDNFLWVLIRGGAEPEYGIRKGTNNVFFTNTYFEKIL